MEIWFWRKSNFYHVFALTQVFSPIVLSWFDQCSFTFLQDILEGTQQPMFTCFSFHTWEIFPLINFRWAMKLKVEWEKKKNRMVKSLLKSIKNTQQQHIFKERFWKSFYLFVRRENLHRNEIEKFKCWYCYGLSPT